jgi:hypothetical protein
MRSIRIAALALGCATTAMALPEPAPAANKLSFEWATATPTTSFTLGGRVKFGFKLRGSGTRDLRVEVVKPGYGKIRWWHLRDVPAGVRSAAYWKGFNLRGKPVKAGRYYFRVRHPGGRKVPLKGVRGRRSFKRFPYVFPVRGAHGYGGASARFGAPRSGHSHQGHDVFARCRTPLVAPRAGWISHRGYQGAAGHYMVLKMRRTGFEAVFMHLARRATYAQGTAVPTGHPIGYLGESGNAQGCHLHFELWRKPGWYKGGSPFDPLPLLRRWDSWS